MTRAGVTSRGPTTLGMRGAHQLAIPCSDVSVAVVPVVVLDQFALPGLPALVYGKGGDDESGRRVQPGCARDAVEAQAQQRGDAEQHADLRLGGVGQDELVTAEPERHPLLGGGQDGHHDDGRGEQDDADEGLVGRLVIQQRPHALEHHVRREHEEGQCHRPQGPPLLALVRLAVPESCGQPKPDEDGDGRLDPRVETKADERHQSRHEARADGHGPLDDVVGDGELCQTQPPTGQPLGLRLAERGRTGDVWGQQPPARPRRPGRPTLPIVDGHHALSVAVMPYRGHSVTASPVSPRSRSAAAKQVHQCLGVVEGEDRCASLRPGTDEAAVLEAGKVLGDRALSQSEVGRQVDHPVLTESQVLKYGEPRRVLETVEQAGRRVERGCLSMDGARGSRVSIVI